MEAHAHHPGLATTHAASARKSVNEWLRLFRVRLKDRRFWVVQLMICAVTAGHALVELFEHMQGEHLGSIYFVPASMYFFPVLYASLNFGREGAIPTAIWSAVLATPNIFWHEDLERFGEAFQMVMMIMLAAIVAWRVDKEISARQAAQGLERERGLSEMKYRALFDGAAEPIVVLDSASFVREANAAAAQLLGRTTADLKGHPAAELFGDRAAAAISSTCTSGEPAEDLHFRRPDGRDIWLEPLCTTVPAEGEETLTQVILQDVTERRGFQHYAGEITRAQEEERLRIAQELHDVSVQSAILICRRLDAAADAAEQGTEEDVALSIQEARHTAETMADELRRFSRDLRPLILDDLGLVPALKRMLLELQERSHLDIRFDVTGPVRRLDSAIELALFRIGQEALRNTENHAEASRASLRVAFGPASVKLTVTDNGSGFTVPPLTHLVSERRLGLLGMQERARLVGGTLNIRSSPGSGTRVIAEIPDMAGVETTS